MPECGPICIIVCELAQGELAMLDLVSLKGWLSPAISIINMLRSVIGSKRSYLEGTAFFRETPSASVKHVKLSLTARKGNASIRSVRLLVIPTNPGSGSDGPKRVSEELATEKWLDGPKFVEEDDRRVILYPLTVELEGQARAGNLCFDVSSTKGHFRVPVSSEELGPLNLGV